MVARVLRLDAVPTPADAADALAIAITHAWRGTPARPASGQPLTPAQAAWRNAERAARAGSIRT
jgi:crossover junction endodeoxyribonuclease RuvC